MIINFHLENDKHGAYHYWQADVEFDKHGMVEDWTIMGEVLVQPFHSEDESCPLDNLPHDVILEIDRTMVELDYETALSFAR